MRAERMNPQTGRILSKASTLEPGLGGKVFISFSTRSFSEQKKRDQEKI